MCQLPFCGFYGQSPVQRCSLVKKPGVWVGKEHVWGDIEHRGLPGSPIKHNLSIFVRRTLSMDWVLPMIPEQQRHLHQCSKGLENLTASHPLGPCVYTDDFWLGLVKAQPKSGRVTLEERQIFFNACYWATQNAIIQVENTKSRPQGRVQVMNSQAEEEGS